MNIEGYCGKEPRTLEEEIKAALDIIKYKRGYEFIGNAYKSLNSVLFVSVGGRMAYMADFISHKVFEIELPNIMVNNIVSHCERIEKINHSEKLG